MPLSFLCELLEYCRAQEKSRIEAQTEKRLFPLWLVSYSLAELSKATPGMTPTEAMPYDEFIKKCFEQDQNRKPIKKETNAAEIMAHFAPIIDNVQRKEATENS